MFDPIFSIFRLEKSTKLKKDQFSPENYQNFMKFFAISQLNAVKLLYGSPSKWFFLSVSMSKVAGTDGTNFTRNDVRRKKTPRTYICSYILTRFYGIILLYSDVIGYCCLLLALFKVFQFILFNWKKLPEYLSEINISIKCACFAIVFCVNFFEFVGEKKEILSSARVVHYITRTVCKRHAPNRWTFKTF